MRILHYSLGFPPFRTGGMTKYCMDLMAEQVRQGHEVSLLWPGELGKLGFSISVKDRGKHAVAYDAEVTSFELRNPLPVPLLNGIRDIDAYTQAKDTDSLRRFLSEHKFDVLHVHTLMGLPKELLDACAAEGIRTVFTSHDYFGICPKWGLERNGQPCIDDHDCQDCIACNESALSLNKVRFLQSDAYRIIKNTSFVKVLRKQNNASLYIADAEETKNAEHVDESLARRYRQLRAYYISLLESFNVLHFNSTNTKEVYSRYCDVTHGEVLSITHGSIQDHRKIRVLHSPVRFGYLGPITKHKGFFALKKTCDAAWKEKARLFELHIYAPTDVEAPYLHKHSPYTYDQLSNVMDDIDMLMVPSQWYETFGFTVLEALSYGIPVIVTENVGAKDLIANFKNGLVCGENSNSLKESLNYILNDLQIVNQMNKYICDSWNPILLNQHSKSLLKLYASKRTKL